MVKWDSHTINFHECVAKRLQTLLQKRDKSSCSASRDHENETRTFIQKHGRLFFVWIAPASRRSCYQEPNPEDTRTSTSFTTQTSHNLELKAGPGAVAQLSTRTCTDEMHFIEKGIEKSVSPLELSRPPPERFKNDYNSLI